MRATLVLALLAVLSLGAAPPSTTPPADPGPPPGVGRPDQPGPPAEDGTDPEPELSVPVEQLEAALTCPETFADDAHEPVLLVHGTFATSEENWAWNYGSWLPAQGWDVCTVDLPDRSLGDIQVAAEYVVYAVRTIAAATGEPVDILAHSQGGLQPRWAMRWWPTTVGAQVDDLVLFAVPNHGTLPAEGCVAFGRCPPAAWQMAPSSTFLALLNDGDETPGPADVTSLYSLTDELVQPAAPEPTAALDGAVNVLIQDLCPGRPVDHLSIVADAAAHAIVLDALLHDGPADPGRFDTLTCAQGPSEAFTPEALPGLAPEFFGSWQGWQDASYDADHEPEPAPYTQG